MTHNKLKKIYFNSKRILCYMLKLGITETVLVYLQRLRSKYGSSTLLSVRPTRHSTQRVLIRNIAEDIHAFEKFFIWGHYAGETISVNNHINIIDVGANIGMSAVYFALRFPKSKIIALEPHPENFELLCLNTLPYPNVIPVHKAVWSASAKLHLKSQGDIRYDSFQYTSEPLLSHGGGDCIAATRVNDIFDDYWPCGGGMFLVKIDIEGAEEELFKESSNWLLQVEYVICEFHDPQILHKAQSLPHCKGFDWEFHGEDALLSRRAKKCGISQ